jgi:hypothetical protein
MNIIISQNHTPRATITHFPTCGSVQCTAQWVTSYYLKGSQIIQTDNQCMVPFWKCKILHYRAPAVNMAPSLQHQGLVHNLRRNVYCTVNQRYVHITLTFEAGGESISFQNVSFIASGCKQFFQNKWRTNDKLYRNSCITFFNHGTVHR